MNRIAKYFGFTFLCFVVAGESFGQDDLRTGGWVKQDKNAPSYFVPIGNKQWVEVSETGRTLSFVETQSDKNTVVLFDAGRNLKIRLRSEFAELSMNDAPFQRWQQGRWLPESELPEFARIAPIDHRVRLIYFVPTDREPTANYEAKIRCLMTFVNSLYKYEFRRRGWNDRGLLFEEDDAGLPKVHLIRGREQAAYYTGSPNYDTHRQYARLQPEIPSSIGSPATHLIVAFLETYDAGPNKYEWPGGVALGGQFSTNGGLGVFSAWILQDQFCAGTVNDQIALFHDSTPIKGRVALGHGRMDSPRFEFIEDGFGAVIHEVGHALGLPHDMRDDRRNIMANGFRQLRANLSRDSTLQSRAQFSDVNAWFLRTSRHLNPNIDLGDQERPRLAVEKNARTDNQPSEPNEATTIDCKASDDRGLAAWRALDPDSGSILDGGELEGLEFHGKLRVTFPDSRPRPKRIKVTVIDRSGNSASVTVDE